MKGIIAAQYLPTVSTVDTDVLSVVNQLFGGRICRDRFNLLNRFCNIRFDLTLTDKLPVPTEKSIAEIINARAQELIASYDTLTAMWSGGVDSTCLVAALVYNGVPLNRFSVLCTEKSLYYARFFYDWLISKGLTVIICDDLTQAISSIDTDCIVNGQCADQMFFHMIHRKDNSLYNLEWRHALDLAFTYAKMPLSEVSLEYLCEHWNHYAKAFDLKLTQFCEFAWLFNFGVRWSYIRNAMRYEFIGSKNADKLTSFFDTYDFQCWALSNYDHLKDYNQMFDYQHYKMPLKQYTYEVTKCDECFNVGKHISNVADKRTKIVVHDSEGIKIYYDLHGLDYEKAGVVISNQYRKRQVLL